jgi:hypothetical protein
VTVSNRKGTVAISRKLFDRDDPFFGGEPFSRREAWGWLIIEASYKARKVKVKIGRAEVLVHLERGQLSHSRSFMREAWGWTSEKVVRTFLDNLEAQGRITRDAGQQTGRHQIIITLCKYNEIQFGVDEQASERGQQRASKPEKTGQRTGQPLGQQTNDVSSGEVETISRCELNGASKQASERGQQRQKKGPELEEGKDKKKNMRSRAGEHAGFAKWYETYPKRKARKAAARAYAKLIASGEISEADLLTRTEAFAAQWRGISLQFCPYPASWLNDGSYADEPDTPPLATAAAASVDPTTFTTDEWQSRVTLYDRGGQWGEHWGPKPGEPGCLVPTSLLNHNRKPEQVST